MYEEQTEPTKEEIEELARTKIAQSLEVIKAGAEQVAKTDDLMTKVVFIGTIVAGTETLKLVSSLIMSSCSREDKNRLLELALENKDVIDTIFNDKE